MDDIYQKIWNADQSGAGVEALLDTATGDPDRGFVKVNTNLDGVNRDLRVLPEVAIPESKKPTYDLCRALFDNYALRERDEEDDSPQEREEVHDLLYAMVDSPPMQVAREYVAEQTGASITRERWYNTMTEMWFRRFSMGGDPHLTGFEHVVVGEQQGSRAQGYHFWYKYYLDDGFAHRVDGTTDRFPGLVSDRIVYLGSRMAGAQAMYPESVTISYRWSAPDYDRDVMRPLSKPVGGFFVGCSVEGLLALGSVRAHIGAKAPKVAEINGARYAIKLFRSRNNRHVRTFYPVFLGPARAGEEPGESGGGTPDTVGGDIHIIAAMINPEGHDPGSESVTLINIGRADQRLDGWRLVDKNARTQSLSGTQIAAGEAVRIVLDPAGVQLSNKGGGIRLMDRDGRIVHAVTYSRGQARGQGKTVLF